MKECSLDQTNAISCHEEAPRTYLPHPDSRPYFLPLLAVLPRRKCCCRSPHLHHPLITQASSPANQPAICVAGLRIRNGTTVCQRDKVLEDKNKSCQRDKVMEDKDKSNGQKIRLIRLLRSITNMAPFRPF